jgi:hypothetical protein
VGGHQAPDGGIDEDVLAAEAGAEEAVCSGNSLSEGAADDAGEVGRDVPVVSPGSFGVVPPADECAERGADADGDSGDDGRGGSGSFSGSIGIMSQVGKKSPRIFYLIKY